jgi:hypothetical protein
MSSTYFCDANQIASNVVMFGIFSEIDAFSIFFANFFKIVLEPPVSWSLDWFDGKTICVRKTSCSLVHRVSANFLLS